MKPFACFALAILLTSLLAAQESESDYKKHEIGGHAGSTTGVGISYRQWFKHFGAQITVLPIKSNDVYAMSLGTTALYTIKRIKKNHIFLYLGNHFFYGNGEYIDYDPITGEEEVKRSDEFFYNIGFGPGFSFGSTVNFSIMLGYGIYDVTNSFNIWPTGEIGVYYMF